MKVYIFYLSDRPRLRLDVGPGPRSNFHLLRCRLHPLELSFSMAYQPHPNFDVHCETKIFALTPKFQMKSALTHRAGATKKEKNRNDQSCCAGGGAHFWRVFQKAPLTLRFRLEPNFLDREPGVRPGVRPFGVVVDLTGVSIGLGDAGADPASDDFFSSSFSLSSRFFGFHSGFDGS